MIDTAKQLVDELDGMLLDSYRQLWDDELEQAYLAERTVAEEMA